MANGCKWRLKIDGSRFLEFDKKEELEGFIAANKNKYSWRSGPEVIQITTNRYVDQIIEKNSNDTFDETKSVKTIKNSNLAITEDRLERGDSDTISVTDLITRPKENNERLVPQVIAENYESDLLKSAIIETLIRKGLNLNSLVFEPGATTERRIKLLKQELFGENIINEDNVEFYTRQASNRFGLEISSKDYDDIKEAMRTIIKSNLEVQLMGEFQHNLFYNLITKHQSVEQVKARYNQILTYMKSRFTTQYKDQRSWIAELADNFTVSKIEFDKLVDDINNVYQTILNDFKGSDGKLRGDVKIYSELDLVADLGHEIDGKSKIRGKLDILVVDGDQITIYDIKYSKRPFSRWPQEKSLTTIYQQAFYGRILNQLGINTNNIRYKVVPMYTINGKTVCEGIEDFTEKVNQNYIIRNINDYIPQIIYDNYRNPEEMDNIDKKISEVIPKEYLLSKTYRINKKYIFENNVIRENGRPKLHKGKIQFIDDTIDSDKIKDKIKYFDSEEEVKAYIDEYVERLKTIRPKLINNFLNQLKAIIKGSSPESLIKRESDARRKTFYKQLLDKYYKQDHYKIVENPNLLDRGIIPIISTTGVIDILVVDELDLNVPVEYSDRSQMKHLFETIAKPGTALYTKMEEMLSRQDMLPVDATRGTVSLFKALVVLNESNQFNDLKIGEVRAINPYYSQSKSFNDKQISFIETTLHEFLGWDKNLTTFKSGSLKGTNRLQNLEDVIIEKVRGIFRVDLGDESRLKKLLNDSELFISQKFFEQDRMTIAKKLEELILQVRVSEKITEYNLNFDIDSHRLYAWLMNLYLYYKRITMFEEGSHPKLFGKDIVHAFDSLMINSMDTIRSQNIVYLRNIMGNVFQSIRNNYTDWMSKMRKEQELFAESQGFSKLRQMTIGDLASMSRNLYRTDTYDLVFKDPWDMKNDLSTGERRMIKFALYTITGKTKREDLDDNDFLVPLMRSRLASNITSDKNPAKTIYDHFAYQFKTAISDTFEERFTEQESAADSFNEMVFEFEDRKNEEKRRNLIQKYGVNAFEQNIELILASYKMAELKRDHVNETLPQLRAIQTVIALQGNLTGNDVTGILDFIKQTVKSSLYEESLVPKEMRKVYGALTALRNIASKIALSWNFANLPREVLMGFWTNISNAMIRRYGVDSFDLGDYAKAVKYLFYDSPKFITEITKIELLNELYAMANMDLKNMVDNTISYKNGLIGGFSRYSGWALTAPDYWNRMSIFIAQMVHDGCFEAHSIIEDKDGYERLYYDMAKDKRFDVYYKYRDHAVPANLKDKYDKQYGMYIAMLKQFNHERASMDLPEYKIGDKFDYAYTVRQRESFKSFADESFGYYDHETKALFNKMWQGMLFKQFMTYLSSKKAQYTLKRTTVASQGHFVPITGVNGQQKYIKIITDKNGYYIDSELTDDNTGIPLYGWQGRVMEGILQTYKSLAVDIYNNIKLTIKKDPNMTQREIWNKYVMGNSVEATNLRAAMYDLFVFLLMGKLFRMALLDDPDESGLSYRQQIADLNWWLRNGIDLVDRSTQDVGIINALANGVFNWEIPSFSIITNAISGFVAAYKIDDLNFAESLLLGTTNVFGFMRPWRVDIKRAFKEKEE